MNHLTCLHVILLCIVILSSCTRANEINFVDEGLPNINFVSISPTDSFDNKIAISMLSPKFAAQFYSDSSLVVGRDTFQNCKCIISSDSVVIDFGVSEMYTIKIKALKKESIDFVLLDRTLEQNERYKVHLEYFELNFDTLSKLGVIDGKWRLDFSLNEEAYTGFMMIDDQFRCTD